MPTTHTTPSPPDPPPTRPTAKQLRYLSALAHQTGQSFTYPHTRQQASAEITRLKAALAATDRRLEHQAARREYRQIARDTAQHAGGATRVRPDETTGHGSSARWS